MTMSDHDRYIQETWGGYRGSTAEERAREKALRAEAIAKAVVDPEENLFFSEFKGNNYVALGVRAGGPWGHMLGDVAPRRRSSYDPVTRTHTFYAEMEIYANFSDDVPQAIVDFAVERAKIHFAEQLAVRHEVRVSKPEPLEEE